MITTNVIHRTFHILWNDNTGTGFTIDHKSKQYLVTARHVVHEIKSGDAIKIFHDKEWKDLVVNVVGVGSGEVDAAILACSVRLSPAYPLVASIAHLGYGQHVSFLGYPFGWDAGGEQINRGVPLPFVKAGIVSAIEFGDVSRIFLDAHGNKGFSGGPVVFVPYGQPQNELNVAGIVSYYPIPQFLPIVNHDGNTITDQWGKPVGYVKENPGFVVAIAIKHALELIDANPIGFQLPADEDTR
ncbi:MAG: serine protease [Nitrospira sp.]|nr:serine protease [Nitrospira sp.]MCY4132106.1 serine protease [Nitrospira sp.]